MFFFKNIFKKRKKQTKAQKKQCNQIFFPIKITTIDSLDIVEVFEKIKFNGTLKIFPVITILVRPNNAHKTASVTVFQKIRFNIAETGHC